MDKELTMILTQNEYGMYRMEFFYKWHEEGLYESDDDFEEELNNFICDCLDVEAFIVEPTNETNIYNHL